MKDAIEPTLMQTLEETPVFVHAGANDRHGGVRLDCRLYFMTLLHATHCSFGTMWGTVLSGPFREVSTFC